MADTVRSKSALIALYADNNTGDISEQDHRDVLATLLGNYAGLSVAGGSTPQSLNTTPAKLTAFTANMAAADMTPAYASANITMAVAGVVKVDAVINAFGEAGITYIFSFAINTTVQSAFKAKYTATATELFTVHLSGLLTVSAGQAISVYGESDAGGGANLTVVNAQLIVLGRG